jgi:hypothetical protein
MRTHTIIRLLAAALLAAGALAVASCGGDDAADGSADRQAQSRDAALKFARCMRDHGVEMPDPAQGGGRQTFKVGPGEDTTPEELEEAQKACEKYQQEIEPPELSEEQQEEFKEAALEHARCMREHGIESFPDPTFDENGAAKIQIDKSSGIDPEDPDFKEAEKACQDKMPNGPGTTSVGGEPDGGAATGGTTP